MYLDFTRSKKVIKEPGDGVILRNSRRVEKAFSMKAITTNVIVICFIFGINRFENLGNLVSYLCLCIMVLRGTEGALKGLSISGIIVLANPSIISKGPLIAPLKFVLIFLAGMTIINAARKYNPKSLRKLYPQVLIVFGVVSALLAITGGYFVHISLLKLSVFTFGTYCLFIGGQSTRTSAHAVSSWIVSLIVFFSSFSLLSLVFGFGNVWVTTLSGETLKGFGGILGHPQTLGSVAGLMAIYLIGLLIYSQAPIRHLIYLLLCALFFLIHQSGARTGMLGVIITLSVVLLVTVIMRFSRRKENRYLSSSIKKIIVFLVIAFLLLLGAEVLSGGSVSKELTNFILKDSGEENISTYAVYESRETLIKRSWQNFKENPIIGIGFGTDRSEAWQSRATLLSASTEKGFWPAAILEEVGVIGTGIFILFLFHIYKFLFLTRRYFGSMTLTGMLVINLGEMMMFSLGGMGLVGWIFVASSMILPTGIPSKCPKNENLVIEKRQYS